MSLGLPCPATHYGPSWAQSRSRSPDGSTMWLAFSDRGVLASMHGRHGDLSGSDHADLATIPRAHGRYVDVDRGYANRIWDRPITFDRIQIPGLVADRIDVQRAMQSNADRRGDDEISCRRQ